MFRSFFIYLSKAAWARRIVTNWQIMRRVSTRFVAGDVLPDAIRVIHELNQKGINASLDLLGENTTTPVEAQNIVREIIDVVETIDKTGVQANVSVKLSQIGLNLDSDLCANNLTTVLECAKQFGNFIRIDMEDSTVTQKTLDLLFQMRNKGFTNVGIVIQSYLYRSDQDISQLITGGIPVRLCKGAYKEPSTVAYPRKRDVDIAYDRLATALIHGTLANGAPQASDNGKIPPLPCLATHDVHRISFTMDLIKKIDLPKKAIEFQMLYGIRRDLQEQLAVEGYPVRVYVPYGTQWYPYYMRRLGERPANAWFILSSYFRK